MNKFCKDVKHAILHYRVKNCCFVVPVRVGLFVIGCLNIIMSVSSLIITADPGSVMPPFVAVQSAILEDNASKTLAFAAYSIELAFNCVLLCGAYRKDRVLLRVYMCFVIVSIMSTFLVYSMVFALLSLLMKIDIIMMNWIYQCYVIVLVWSAMVKIKDEQSLKNMQHNDIVYYQIRKPYDDQIHVKIERPDSKDVIVSAPELKDKNLPSCANTASKDDEISQPEQTNNETLQFGQKNDSTSQSEQKSDQTIQPDQENGESLQSEQKTDETVQHEQKSDEPVKPKKRSKEARKLLKRNKPLVTLETVSEHSK